MRAFYLLAMLGGWPHPMGIAQPPEKADTSPRLTLDDLDFLTGKWAGSLEYLDFTDNQTRHKIAASLACKRAHDAFDYKFSFVEPGGKKVDGDSTKVTLVENGSQLRLNDETWRVASRLIDAKNQKYEVVLTREGPDDKKPAKLRRVISLDKDTLTIRTEVLLEKAEKSFVRNEYVLKKR